MGDYMSWNQGSGNDDEWDANRYERSGGFVWEYGEDVLSLLDPHPDERILDLGCGTGHLSANRILWSRCSSDRFIGFNDHASSGKLPGDSVCSN